MQPNSAIKNKAIVLAVVFHAAILGALLYSGSSTPSPVAAEAPTAQASVGDIGVFAKKIDWKARYQSIKAKQVRKSTP